MRTALIVGLAGETLTRDERAFLRDCRPAGVILFARNCAAADQIARLVSDARTAAGAAADDFLVLIDQEGGRVRRLRPPLWRALPSAAAYAAMQADDPLKARRAAWLSARLTARDLSALGINTNCAPVLDLRVRGAHEIIGDRAYGETSAEVARLARAVAEGYIAGGVVPVVKHIPGHGRAMADSHFELPAVDTPRAELEATDFAPFRALRDMPAAMTAHVVYSAIDATGPASTSAIVTAEIIRGYIGFDRLLMSDDLGMKALTGSFRERAAAVSAAGSAVALHGSGNLEEMHAAASGVPRLTGRSRSRLEACIAITRREAAFDVAEAEAALAEAVEADAMRVA